MTVIQTFAEVLIVKKNFNCLKNIKRIFKRLRIYKSLSLTTFKVQYSFKFLSFLLLFSSASKKVSIKPSETSKSLKKGKLSIAILRLNPFCNNDIKLRKYAEKNVSQNKEAQYGL